MDSILFAISGGQTVLPQGPGLTLVAPQTFDLSHPSVPGGIAFSNGLNLEVVPSTTEEASAAFPPGSGPFN